MVAVWRYQAWREGCLGLWGGILDKTKIRAEEALHLAKDPIKWKEIKLAVNIKEAYEWIRKTETITLTYIVTKIEIEHTDNNWYNISDDSVYIDLEVQEGEGKKLSQCS